MSVPSMEELARTICLAVWNYDYTPRDPKHPDERWAQALAAARAVLDRLKPVVAKSYANGALARTPMMIPAKMGELGDAYATRTIDKIKGA